MYYRTQAQPQIQDCGVSYDMNSLQEDTKLTDAEIVWNYNTHMQQHICLAEFNNSWEHCFTGFTKRNSQECLEKEAVLPGGQKGQWEDHERGDRINKGEQIRLLNPVSRVA